MTPAEAEENVKKSRERLQATLSTLPPDVRKQLRDIVTSPEFRAKCEEGIKKTCRNMARLCAALHKNKRG